MLMMNQNPSDAERGRLFSTRSAEQRRRKCQNRQNPNAVGSAHQRATIVKVELSFPQNMIMLLSNATTQSCLTALISVGHRNVSVIQYLSYNAGTNANSKSKDGKERRTGDAEV